MSRARRRLSRGDEGVPASTGPVVTLFEQYGAGAEAIGTWNFCWKASTSWRSE